MTTAFSGGAWPSDPTMPSGPPAGLVTPAMPPDPSRNQPPMTSAQVEAQRNQFYELLLRQVLFALTGISIPAAGSSFEQIQAWAGTVGLGDLFEILTGVEDADKNDLGTWVNTLLGINRPVPEVQAAAVVDTNPNLVMAPNFPTPGTVVGQGNWLWTNSFGHDSIGCAQVVAAGYVSEMVSNQIRVQPGQIMDLSVWVKWAGLSYTGTNPISMGVTRYMTYAEVGFDDLAFFATPAGTQDWTQLAKTAYTVPAGCDEIRLRFKIGANLTVGNVYWDDAVVIKNQPGSGYIGSAIDNMVNGLENLNQPGWDLIDLLISMLNQFRTATDTAARVTYLETLLSSGNKINDEFLRVGSTLGANWSQFYIGSGAGTWQTDGDYAFWNKSGVADLEVRCRYIGTPSTTSTDTQRIIAVLGSKGEDAFSIFHTYIDLYGRMNTTGTEGTDWIRARFGSNGTVTITRNLAGVQTPLVTVAGYDFLFNPTGPQAVGGGATIELICGTASGPRYFEARINGSAVATINDATSALGAGFQGYGHGAKSAGSILILGQIAPPKLNAWAAIDN